MSFLLDRKREHETQAAGAVRRGDFGQALHHAVQVAEIGFQLAEQAEGLIADKYAEDASEWVAIAKRLKAKLPPQQASISRPAVTSGGAEEEGKAATTWQLQERPEVRLSEVAGMDDVKAELDSRVIQPFQHPDVYQRFKAKVGGGVLMYGPPGNGKTFIARAVAGELDAAFFLVDASQIKDKYVGETEKKLTSLFDEAHKHPKAVVFFDEVDDLLGQRGNQKIGTVTTFLKLADGFVKNDGCLLILAATNRPWLLAPAVLRPGRLGTHVYVGMPDEPARKAILEYCFREVPTAGMDFASVAAKAIGYSGAELAEVCDRAKKKAIERQLESRKDEAVLPGDLELALVEVSPQTTEQQLKDYDRWKYSRDRGPKADADEE